MDYVTLNDGNKIPAVGFGVFMIPNDGPTYDAVLAALKAGYRHIDSAAAYFNEEDVGKAVRDSGIPREEIFVTSKLWLQDHGYEAAKKGIKTLGGELVEIHQFPLYADGEEQTRYIIEIKKTSPTPAAYPRQYAKIKKKPL